MCNSKQGKGSLCLGVMNVAFVALEEVTEKAEAIYQKAKDEVEGLLKQKSDLPGIADQLKIQLERIQPGKGQVGPGCEFIMTPGLIVSPGRRFCQWRNYLLTGRPSSYSSGEEVL